jgi:hypothetical protein
MEPQAIILTHLLQQNYETTLKQLDGISQAESLLQLPFRGNCLNWVVGHLLGVHGECLDLLGLPGTLSASEEKLYGYGSEPLTDPKKALALPDLLQRLEQSYTTLTGSLANLKAADLKRQVQIWRGKVSLHEGLAFMLWHAAYHTGQLELLRQLAGKNDKVI